ncbi:hypothetical protein [Methylobacterium sp. E-066]|uniref:hypothetical protein n=1 Tax=Methylobacterium sp. E-066 TaxID=2836584 RepID=UPI001FB88B32|nr:hypothetical protein [Methylobacterium sp. E-066]MCJ2138460.1 hypothetical protein [Methylobacterium sp. E-066]
MSEQYLRNMSVEIEGGATWTYRGDENGGQGLRMTFEITMKDTSTPNVARIGIYNLKDSSTQSAFFVGKRVKVSAGYVTGQSYVLFDGEIRQARNLRTDVTDKVLAILATDGSTPRNYAVVNKTLSAGHTHNDRVMACFEPMKALGIGLGFIDTAALSKVKFSRGAALFGNVKDHLRQICAATRTSWSIQKGKLQVLGNDKALPGGEIVLNSRTGLVGMPIQTIQGIEGVALLNGNIVPGCVVRIDQKSIQQAEYDPSITGEPNNKLLNQFGISSDGRYKVFYVGHVGDSRGESFFTNFICVRLDALSSSYALSSRGIGSPTNGQ